MNSTQYSISIETRKTDLQSICDSYEIYIKKASLTNDGW